ncbi:type IV minor pilin protein FimT [Shewanella sp. NFH-SH190041]|uniref:GspH/FimT family pseudopilin n=1 Tax=Shewanella sp. NFH-SH190041 TaxID=2950245 RepID=UPI0021C3BCAE|nr:GspH/FimT family pseudopilin [Shewanella sp. NFH-SH190041]BDM63681.1 type IV minor pilin protein FimT [Shewanella sp. NFH-SH190041]
MSFRQSGLTLVELAVITAIILILLAVTLPSMQSNQAQSRIDAAASQLHQAISLARNQAMSYHSRVTLCPLSGSLCGKDWHNTATIFTDNGVIHKLDSAGSRADTIIQHITTFDVKDRLIFPAAISFNAQGKPLGQSGDTTFTLCAPQSNYAATITITSGGTINPPIQQSACPAG